MNRLEDHDLRPATECDGPSKIIHTGPWQVPVKAIGVLCPDGKRRTVQLGGTPDTFWTIPGRISFRGKTVTGIVMSANDYDTDEGCNLKFVPQGKNAHVFD